MLTFLLILFLIFIPLAVIHIICSAPSAEEKYQRGLSHWE